MAGLGFTNAFNAGAGVVNNAQLAQQRQQQLDQNAQVLQAKQQQQALGNAMKAFSGGVDQLVTSIKAIKAQGGDPKDPQFQNVLAPQLQAVKNAAIMGIKLGIPQPQIASQISKIQLAMQAPSYQQQQQQKNQETQAEAQAKAAGTAAGTPQKPEDFMNSNGDYVGSAVPGTPQAQAFQKQGAFPASMAGDRAALNPKKSALQQRVDAMVEAGTPRDTALKIASGQWTVSVNPQDNSRQVIDVATGNVVGGSEATPKVKPSGIQSLIAPNIDFTTSVGIRGVLSGMVNTISDGLGLGAADPNNQKADKDLERMKYLTSAALLANVPGRKGEYLWKEAQKFSVDPNSFFEGKSGAMTDLQQTKGLLDAEIGRLQGLLGKPLKPSVQQEIVINLSQLKGLSNAYGQLIQNAGIANSPPQKIGRFTVTATPSGKTVQ